MQDAVKVVVWDMAEARTCLSHAPTSLRVSRIQYKSEATPPLPQHSSMALRQVWVAAAMEVDTAVADGTDKQ